MLAKMGKAVSAAARGGGSKTVGPDANGKYPKGTCDKCDGPHLTDACPIYKKKRDDHPDAWRNFGRKTPLEMGTCARARSHALRESRLSLCLQCRDKVETACANA